MTSRASQKERARARREAEEQAALAADRRRARLLRLAGIGALAIVAVVAAVAISQSSGKDDTATPQALARAPAEVAALFRGIPQDGTSLGSASAPVTLTEFADLQCPFCRRFAVDALPVIVERYVRPGRVRLEFRDLAFLGPDSERAARVAAAAAAQDRLWQFVELFYRNQGEESSGYVTDAFLRKLAAGVPSLDVERAMRASESEAAARPIAAARAQAQRLGIDSTPSFTVGPTGGQARVLVSADLTAEAFAKELDAELARR